MVTVQVQQPLQDGTAILARANRTRVLHPIAGAVALLTTAIIWLSTLATHLFGSRAAVVAVETTIPWAFLLLVPALALALAFGSALAKGQKRGLVGAKTRRMPIIVAS